MKKSMSFAVLFVGLVCCQQSEASQPTDVRCIEADEFNGSTNSFVNRSLVDFDRKSSDDQRIIAGRCLGEIKAGCSLIDTLLRNGFINDLSRASYDRCIDSIVFDIRHLQSCLVQHSDLLQEGDQLLWSVIQLQDRIQQAFSDASDEQPVNRVLDFDE